MNTFNFTEVVRNRHTNDFVPAETLRITNKSFTIARSEADKYVYSTTKGGYETTRVQWAYDKEQNAIKLTPSEAGHSMNRTASGAIHGTLPAGMVRQDVRPGDYKLVAGTTDIYQLTV